MNVSVTGTGLYPQGVTWSISGNTDTTTNIARDGYLYFGKAETGTITITATSVFDKSKTGIATATKG